MSAPQKLSIVFLHPDLGIGGAERAMVDAALALQEAGHSVQFLTAHHDKSHCFEETQNGDIEVQVAGDWLPRSILSRFKAFCAYLRMIYAAMILLMCSSLRSADLIICDQVSAPIPLLKLFGYKVIFYCHFPDLLLTERKSFLKRVYRAPLDWLEEKTTGMADKILVNSKFTGGVFKSTFLSLSNHEPAVLYPVPALQSLDVPLDESQIGIHIPEVKHRFLSINRYERKKNVGLSIKALAKLISRNPNIRNDICLVIAGGYDHLVTENKEHYEELVTLARELEISDLVVFVRSCSMACKLSLLRSASALLYTPDREHFGIVPIEAMYSRCPVIAVNSGGPTETIVNEKTGFLCDPYEADFADAMQKFIDNPELKTIMGEHGRNRVIKNFSYTAFKHQIYDIVSHV